MDINWLDQVVQEERRKDMLRAAAQRHLIARAGASARRPPLYAEALVRMGQWLERRGRRIQLRYGVIAEAAAASGEHSLGC